MKSAMKFFVEAGCERVSRRELNVPSGKKVRYRVRHPKHGDQVITIPFAEDCFARVEEEFLKGVES